ncbi:hypothetical protein EXIGLDRAFT_781919 [Exidia glandulosa HHB12029]|uniref:Uncharacterized protein n=1 Tax=Exidia glandulosa HHB12029 TaxID=1314781 RepID=A0A165B349_EXIGL|nr:hypothetical protein EXIGLDRAFT_781919 [Exidia glandulosa HHB12029]
MPPKRNAKASKGSVADAPSVPAPTLIRQPLLPPDRLLPPSIDWNAVTEAAASTARVVPPQPRAPSHPLEDELLQRGTARYAVQFAKECPLRDEAGLKGFALYPCVRARVLQHDDCTELYLCQVRSFWPLYPLATEVLDIADYGGAEALLEHILLKPNDQPKGTFRLPLWLYQPLRILIHEIAHTWFWRRWYVGDLEGGLLRMRQYEAYKIDVLNALCKELFEFRKLGTSTREFYPASLHWRCTGEGSKAALKLRNDPTRRPIRPRTTARKPTKVVRDESELTEPDADDEMDVDKNDGVAASNEGESSGAGAREQAPAVPQGPLPPPGDGNITGTGKGATPKSPGAQHMQLPPELANASVLGSMLPGV